ncbi:MAG TPA: putative lipid II flippase FtsW [Patescibacteria group bacterium]|nr:putative lipid II flippase FtsW [Patescibacteria group bacterium]
MMNHVQQKGDRILLGIVILLVVFGLVMIASAGVVYSETRFDDHYFFFKRQLLFGVLPGFAALFFFQRLDYNRLRQISVPFFALTIIFLILVFVPGVGTELYGASRWLQFGSFSFQPSEMAKFALVLYLAAWFASKGEKKIRDFFEGFLPFLAILGIASFLIIKQPDMGTMMVIVLIAFSLFFVSGARLAHLIGMALVGSAALFFLVKSAPYRFDRFMVFLHPELDPQGIGYQINQALLAIGSGGLFGLGLGHSRQKFNYLPEPVGDSIFAIIGEELGLIGAALVVVLFVAFALRVLKIARRAPDMFGRLVAIGIIAWIIGQAFVNIAAITALIPLTGIPLPFISYGGTSLVFLLYAVGVLLNISKQTKLGE